MWQDFAKWKYAKEGLKYFTLMVVFSVFSIKFRDTSRGVAYITSEEAGTIASWLELVMFSVVLGCFSAYCECAPSQIAMTGTTNPPAPLSSPQA